MVTRKKTKRKPRKTMRKLPKERSSKKPSWKITEKSKPFNSNWLKWLRIKAFPAETPKNFKVSRPKKPREMKSSL
jgi:hypothetical protein